MSPKKGRNNFERLFSGQIAMKGENFQFTGHIEAVAAFCFDGGCAVGSKLPKGRHGAGFQILDCSRAKLLHGIEDATALTGDLLVGGSLNLKFVFFGTAGRVNQMSV